MIQRRLVSATNDDGEQTFVSDKEVRPFHREGSHPDSLMFAMWGLDGVSSLPSDGSRFDYKTPIPPAGGFRFEVFHVPPDGEAADFDLPSLGASMHQTPTLDVIFVVRGQITIALESGEERILHAGDTYVSHGTNHAWHNRSDVVCTMVSAMIGAAHGDGPEWMKV